MQYTVVFEKSPNNHAAYLPDLPGCVATGATKAEVARLVREAIALHLESLHQDGLPASRRPPFMVSLS